MSAPVSVKSCFVIAPIGDDGTEVRKRSDQVLQYVIKEALVPRNYQVVRADEIAKPGSITTQVIEMVMRSELVIADLTGHNPNVFYELAVRHAVQKPLIHMISASERIPFDVADFRTISVQLDLDGAARARKELCAQVDEIEQGSPCITPLSLAGILFDLDKSQSEDKVVLRQLLEGFGELRAESREMYKELSMRLDIRSGRFVNNTVREEEQVQKTEVRAIRPASKLGEPKMREAYLQELHRARREAVLRNSKPADKSSEVPEKS